MKILITGGAGYLGGALADIYKMPMIWNVHPHVRKQLDGNPRLRVKKGIKVLKPFILSFWSKTK